MVEKLNVAVLCGGKSAEHEVSLLSAANVLAAMDRTKYDVTLIGIDRTGRWFLCSEADLFGAEGEGHLAVFEGSDQPLAIVPGDQNVQLMNLASGEALASLDVAFPVLHGPFGEDGTVQGLLKLMGVPFVGPSIAGSAVGMDKDMMKRLLCEAGLPVGKFVVMTSPPETGWRPDDVIAELGMPIFVKPANMGSSVGIRCVNTSAELVDAIHYAFRFDRKVILEQTISGREIECSVLGNEAPVASVPGEVVPHSTFYSYEAKYVDAAGADLRIPAALDAAVVDRIKDLALRTFTALCCEGCARVDLFLCPNGDLIINEINTLPGFTAISMFPRLWMESGIAYSDLIDRLIALAMERSSAEAALLTSAD